MNNNLALALVAFVFTGAEFARAGMIKTQMNVTKKQRVKGESKPISLASRANTPNQ